MEAKTLALYLGAECMIGDMNWKPDPNTYGLDPMSDPDFGKPIRTTIDLHCIMAFDHKITPILRPLSSMTEEEALEWNEKFRYFAEGSTEQYVRDRLYLIIQTVNENRGSNPDKVIWLLSKGFDLFGLIEKGDALDATKVEKVKRDISKL